MSSLEPPELGLGTRARNQASVPGLSAAGFRASDVADLEGFKGKRDQMQKWMNVGFNFEVGNILKNTWRVLWCFMSVFLL